MKYKILSTSRSFGNDYRKPREVLESKGCEIIANPFGRPLKEDDLSSIIKGMDGVIVGVDEVSAKVIKAADKLKVISKHGVGVDNIDIEAARAKGIAVTNTPGVNSDAVADLAFGLILCSARKIIESHLMTRSGDWKRICGVSVWGKTIGIIGLGRIGRGIVTRAEGFNMKVIATDIFKDENFIKEHRVLFCELNELLVSADFIVMACNVTDATRGFISDSEFSLMKESAFFINTARAELVNTDALVRALKNKSIAGAAVDVYEIEPPEGNPLLELDNVITTSHIGAYADEAMTKMGDTAAQNVIDILLTGKCNNAL
jgi:D-3-phosphoglycerate dehydrogenase